MENENDVQLIRKVLSGDEDAFSILVQKYQKGIHALAWRRVRDFHLAEEIVQDVFLEAYERLSTLKDHRRFAGWLYVITNRLCINWMRKNKPVMQSLQDTSSEEIDRLSYEYYVSEQRDVEATERSEAIVKALLKKLPESQQTVVTLYYLSGMTTKEIGKFLGVSVNTITSRLQRARKHLQEQEELLISEILGSFQLPVDLTESIMRQVADIKPTPPSVSKPFLPWVALGTAVALIVLMLGTSNQYLVHFQKPYSFEAASEPTIEIIDAPITLTIDSKPAVRNQAGRLSTSTENSGVGRQTPEQVSISNTQVNLLRPSISQWTQTSGPQGSHISEIFVTSAGHLYTATATGIYTLTSDATTWTLINTSVPTGNFPMPIAAYNDTLYIISSDGIFTSTNSGETWNALGPRPKGEAIGLIITDEKHESSSLPSIEMYLALEDKGVFRSTDAGRQWDPLNDGLVGKRIYAVDAVRNTVFAGTNEGLYRLNADVWERLPLDASNAIHSLAVRENNLYVATGPDPFGLGLSKTDGKYATQRIIADAASPWKIFHSTDLGMLWTEITPKDKPSVMVGPRSVNILIAGKTLLVLDGGLSFRSNDDGQTWEKLGLDRSSIKQNIFTTAAVDENTFYIAGVFGVHRTIDSGDSWHPFMEGIVGTRIRSLTAFNNGLYAHAGSDILQSTDNGESWKMISVDTSENKFESLEQEPPGVDFSFDAKLAVTGGGLYGIVPDGSTLKIFSLSTDNNTFIRVQGIPAFDGEMLATELWTAIAKAERVDLPDDIEKNAKLMNALRGIATFVVAGGFVVSNDTFYVEHQRRLFKWKPGDPEWSNTGLIDLGKQLNADFQNGFKLAVSGEIVYVGKRTGQLFQSLNGGDTWRDITPILPLRFERFNEIIFVGSTVYVATDKGVITSQNGESWRNLTDENGTPIVMDRFAVDHTALFGAGDTGVYRLDTRSKWQQISPNVPDKVRSLVINNDRLYIATQHRGIFHISLGEEYCDELSQK